MLEPLKKISNTKIMHQLNNEGCLCEMCQKLTRRQNMKIKLDKIIDFNSQEFNPEVTKEYYLNIIKEMINWQKKSRKLRYMIPEICIYFQGAPVQRIAKRKQSGGLVWIHDKSKMHMFEIIHFFLEGFIFHKKIQPKNEETTLKPITHKKNSNRGKKTDDGEDKVVGIYSEKYKNECIVVGKYKNNFFNMFTLGQMETLFKSRYKYLRDGLIYLQTIIQNSENTQTRINIEVRKHIGTEIYERAKNEVRMILEEVKPSDMDYITQEQEIQYEEALKKNNHRQYLEYLTLKIILLYSRGKQYIISKAVFKFIFHKGYEYIWDIRVDKLEVSDQFWAAGMMKAFEFRLYKRMSMMEIQVEKEKAQLEQDRLGFRTKDLKKFLENSTSVQWSQMSVIRNRLQRLQKEKKSLMQSQSFAQGDTRSIFKVRNIKK